jgi:hypothetical protein
MTRLFSRRQRFANMERSFEFSRLHAEWMAAVYALVVAPQQQGSRSKTEGDQGQNGKSRRQRKCQATGGIAG